MCSKLSLKRDRFWPWAFFSGFLLAESVSTSSNVQIGMRASTSSSFNVMRSGSEEELIWFSFAYFWRSLTFNWRMSLDSLFFICCSTSTLVKDEPSINLSLLSRCPWRWAMMSAPISLYKSVSSPADFFSLMTLSWRDFMASLYTEACFVSYDLSRFVKMFRILG